MLTTVTAFWIQKGLFALNPCKAIGYWVLKCGPHFHKVNITSDLEIQSLELDPRPHESETLGPGSMA